MVAKSERFGLSYCMMKRKREIAMKAVEASKELILKKHYNKARECIEVAMEHDPSLENGFPMWVVCETLFRADIELSNRKVDSYSVLHLHPSTDSEEVKRRSEDLIREVAVLNEMGFPGVRSACNHLRRAEFSLSKRVMRERLDTQRMASCLFDRLKVPSEGRCCRESYLGWKPPVYNFDVSESLKSKKGASTAKATCSHCAEEEVGDVKTHDVFREMPQNPHYGPLMKYSQEVREGMIRVLDLAFVHLCEEIYSLVDPQHFWLQRKRFYGQLAELKDMGYNVDKLQRDLDTLEKVANCDREIRVAMDIFGAEVIANEGKMILQKSRFLALEEDMKKSRTLVSDGKHKIEALKKDLEDIAVEFLSKVKHPRGNEV